MLIDKDKKRKTMNTICKITTLFGLFLTLSVTVYGQSSGTSPCAQGNEQPTDTIPSKPDPHPSDSTNVPVYDPYDPNEIIGTRGYDALGDTLQWVAVTASLPYTIYFENDPELATAAAQKVEVRHRLHAKADISTFAIGAFGFGSHVFTVEGNRSSYQQRLDLTQDMGIYVDVVAGIDIVAGEAFWILQSIDPATGLPPQGTQQGFLPVNDENHSGEGYVSFTIRPKANACVTGDELTASASIVFDINEAIPTNVWHNTVDALPPTTQLTGQEGNDNEVQLQFSGTDDEGGCGIKQYKLYVSDNYGAYSLYNTYPTGSEAVFPTEYDHCYRFFCLGEDNVGNLEEIKETAEYEFGNYNLLITVAASPEEGGTVGGGNAYVYGSNATLTAIPNLGYTFVNWTKNNEVVSTNPTYCFTVTEAGGYVANFMLNSYDIFATAEPTEGGSVTGAGIYYHFETCTLTAIANDGYIFTNWTKDGTQVSDNPSYSFTVTEAGNYVANFQQNCTVIVASNPTMGGTVSGGGIYDVGATVTLTATANAGYTFLSWTANGAMLSTSPTCTFTVTGNTSCVARFYSGDAALQISPFTSGWNWYSTYIGQESIDGLAQLEGNLGSSGIQIKSQQQYVNYYEGMGWMGMLSSINNESTYKIKTSAPCVVEMIGEETTSAAHPITIGPGWNWIGYPVNASMSITDALSGIEPSNGDQLKAQNGYANYYEGMGWMGTLSTITPSMGLLYKSYGSGAFTLVYPTGTKGETLVENITSENNYWVPDMHAYPDNMTVTAVVELDDNELQSDHYELAAFANGECRGSVRLMYIEALNRYIAFLTIVGEEVEPLSFSLYDTQTGEEIYDAQENLNFSNNATVGDVRTPYVIHFRGLTGTDEWANNIHVFPNPVARGENVSLGSTEGIGKVQVEIINSLGVVVQTLRATSVQTIAAPDVAGVYTLRITAEGKGTCYRKLVVR